jgi:hypothetical protein
LSHQIFASEDTGAAVKPKKVPVKLKPKRRK